jgi:tetratricopeptide (TPR) repeat protein
MSIRSCFLITVGAGMLFAATPSFAASSWPANNLVADGLVRHCATAAAAAVARNNVADADVAKCTKAAALAGFDVDKAAALSNRSVLYFKSANYNAAIEDSTAALKLDDTLTEAMVNRGASYMKLHRPRDAEANFSRALTKNPAHAEKIYFNRAMAREDMGDLNGAYADYAAAWKLAPEWDQPREQMIRFTIVPRKPIS